MRWGPVSSHPSACSRNLTDCVPTIQALSPEGNPGPELLAFPEVSPQCRERGLAQGPAGKTATPQPGDL